MKLKDKIEIKKLYDFADEFIKKTIPGQIRIRSLFWIQYTEKMEDQLGQIFDAIDLNKYSEAKILIDNFEKIHNQSEVPFWVAEKMAKIYKAKSMLVFFTVPLKEEPLEILYKEMLEREQILSQEPATDVNNGRMAELGLAIIRTQQLLLTEVSNELESRKTTKR